MRSFYFLEWIEDGQAKRDEIELWQDALAMMGVLSVFSGIKDVRCSRVLTDNRHHWVCEPVGHDGRTANGDI